MRLLIDTNIFIYREDNSEVDRQLSALLKILSENNVSVLMHPDAKLDILNDKDERRKKIILSKLDIYPLLESPPRPDNDREYLLLTGDPVKQNDIIDNNILYAVYRNAVSFLISNDNQLVEKADKLLLSDRVFNIYEAYNYFTNLFRKVTVDSAPPAIRKLPLHNISLNDPFFNTLKNDYNPLEFEEWYNQKAREGATAWVYKYDNGFLGAFLLLKEENEIIHTADRPLPQKKRLKVSTLKVFATGLKIGELFIKISVEYAIKKNIDEIYLTHYDAENDSLLPLINSYGFTCPAIKPDGEKIYIKQLKPPAQEKDPRRIRQLYYPSIYDGEQCRKFLVPIIQTYHNQLFQDSILSETSLFYQNELVIEANTIKKAYLSHSKIKKIQPGDLLLFYLSHTFKTITALGVVDQVFNNLSDPEEIIQRTGKRTVFNRSEIQEFARRKTLLLLFKWHFYFNDKLTYDNLIEEKIISGPLQSICEISHEQYLILKSKGGIDNDFTVN